jgi:hypothetical protein
MSIPLLTANQAVIAASNSRQEILNLEGIPCDLQASYDPSFPPEIRVEAVFNTVPEAYRFRFLAANLRLLSWYQRLEKLFLIALTGTRTNNHYVDVDAQRFLLSHCRRDRLMRAGSKFEQGQPQFAIFRGVAGAEDDDARPQGLSWTTQINVAAFFAISNAHGFSLPRPRVYMAMIDPVEVYAYWDRRAEQEIIASPHHPTDLGLTYDCLVARASAQQAQWQRQLVEPRSG